MAQIRGREVTTGDLGIMGAGLVVFVAGFLPWYGASVAGYSASANGWDSGFPAWFSILLCLTVAGTVAAGAFGNVRPRGIGPVGPALTLVIVSGLAVLLILIRWLTLPDADGLLLAEVESGAKAGLFLGLVAAGVMTGFAVLRLLTSGEPIPGRGGRPTDGGADGYGQPPRPY